jgi:transcriptional regulator of acetoin/glycerol metabolism
MIPKNPQLTADWTGNRPKARVAIRYAMIAAGGNVSEAAKALDTTRRTLHRYLKEEPELGIVTEEEKAAARERRRSA